MSQRAVEQPDLTEMTCREVSLYAATSDTATFFACKGEPVPNGALWGRGGAPNSSVELPAYP